jgi:glycosyltransferase involved in cell wall biosynthesis
MGRSPGQRFRFEQYLDYLKQNGYEFEISNFLNERDDRLFYSKGNYLHKFRILLQSIYGRLKDIRRASDYGIVFIYRDAIMIRSTFFERQFHKSKAKVIFDFDDALWLTEVSEGNANLGWLKSPAKTKDIIRLSDMVFAGNAYLADYARHFNNNVKIVPTTIDTDYFKHTSNPELRTQNSELKTAAGRQRVCIGWTGTSTTMKHLRLSLPVLKILKEKYGNKVYIKVISDVPFHHEGLEIQNCKWNRETEIEDLSWFDIGIMPLPEDEWSKGKCGFKGLQYMALEIPCVMSPVGVNKEIIQNGINGYLPKDDSEWLRILSMLIESKELRDNIGRQGRQTVIEHYSFHSQKQSYLNYFNELIK